MNKIIIIFVFLVLLLSCKKNVNNNVENLSNKTDFKYFFQEINTDSIVNIFRNISGISPVRAGDEMLIRFLDSTIVIFYRSKPDKLKIINKNQLNNLSDEDLLNKSKNIINIFIELNLKAFSNNNILNCLQFTFDINKFKKDTLPIYIYSNDKFKNLKTELDTGYLVYGLDKVYEYSEEFKNIQPIKIKNNWYYYAF